MDIYHIKTNRKDDIMIEELKKKIEDSYYWDARVKALDCNYFGDEVKLVFEDGKNNITYYFEGCYKVNIEHAVEYTKDRASRELTSAQIPYFMQNVELKEIKIFDKKNCSINKLLTTENTK